MAEDPHNYQRWVNIYQPFSISARIHPISTHYPQKGLFKTYQPNSTSVSTHVSISPNKPSPPQRGFLMTFPKAAEALDDLSLAPGSEARQARKALIERIEWLGDDDGFWLSIFGEEKKGVKFDGESMNITAKC